MTSLRRVTSSLFWLAGITSAQFFTITQPSKPEPTTVPQRGPTGVQPPDVALASTPTGTVPPEVLPTPTMYNLNSSDPDSAEPAVDYFQVDLDGDVSIEQAAVFRGIPAGAKSCLLKWRQAAASERRFLVGKHGRTVVRQLSGFPSGYAPVTYNSLAAFEPANATRFSPDFTFWPDNQGPFDHIAGVIPCSEDIYLRIALNKADGDGFVHLDQDEQNGFYIQYTLA